MENKFDSENTYWNGKGKYEILLKKLSPLLPREGFTENAYLNLLILTKNIYYDIYNNGGCNLDSKYYKEKINEYVMPFAKETGFKKYLIKKTKDYNYEMLEEFVDKVILFAYSHNVDFYGFPLGKNLEDFYAVVEGLKFEGQESRAQAVIYLIERCKLAEEKILK